MQEDWDVLGVLPPRKRQRLNLILKGISTPIDTSRSRSKKAEDAGEPKSSAKTDTSASSASKTNTQAPLTEARPKHSKARIPQTLPKLGQESLTEQVSRLTKEKTELQAVRDFVDRKIKALTIFGAHQDNAIFLLAEKFRACQKKEVSGKEELVMDESTFVVGFKAD